MFWKKLHPEHWTWRFYLGTGLFLAAINLFGPMGLVHWLLVDNEARRLGREEKNLEQNILKLKSEMHAFNRSTVFRERSIRQELGFLKANEMSVEFIDGNEGVGTR